MPIEIHPLRPFTKADVWPLLDGYDTTEIYQIEQTESALLARIDCRLVTLDQPLHDDFYGDFSDEEIENWNTVLQNGYSFGAYQGAQLVGLAVAEAWPAERKARVWEFHVHPGWRRAGVGRALMERVLAKARQDGLGLVFLETQNTNVRAIRFYRALGFALGAVDIGHYYPSDNPVVRQQAQFLMKCWLEQPAG